MKTQCNKLQFHSDFMIYFLFTTLKLPETKN